MTNRLDGFVFGQGKFKDVPPCEVPDAYLLTQWQALKAVPEGHEYRETFDAICAELEARGKLPEAPVQRQPPNNAAFRVPPPIPAAEAARRARAHANGAAQASVGPPAAPRSHQTAPPVLMPCGHPTEDLTPVEGSWKGLCRGCDRLQRALTGLASGNAADILLAFEAEIRGFKGTA